MLQMGYFRRVVLSIAVNWTINQFSLNWNVYICMLVEYTTEASCLVAFVYFGSGKSTHMTMF